MTTLKALSLAGLLFSITTTYVHGQSAPVLNDEQAVSSTTPVVLSEPVRWFTSDFVSGNPLVGDFVVGPGRSELNISPGDSVITYLTVTNRISDARKFKLEVADVTGSADGSSALDLIEGENPGPYSIRDYISFPETTFTLALGERAKIPVLITLPPNIEPGGLYGTILVSTIQAPLADGATNAPRNPIIARVGSHVFLNVEGEKSISGQALDMITLPSKFWYESGPINLAISYENTGSVHLNPYGELSIKNTFGEEVGYVQLEPWFVLPASIRTRDVEWDRDFLFGRYTAVASINRGYDDIVDEIQVSFWVLPWKLLAVTFGVTFLLIFIFRLFFKTFEFKRK